MKNIKVAIPSPPPEEMDAKDKDEKYRVPIPDIPVDILEHVLKNLIASWQPRKLPGELLVSQASHKLMNDEDKKPNVAIDRLTHQEFLASVALAKLNHIHGLFRDAVGIMNICEMGWLLNEGANINHQIFGDVREPLHYAASMGNQEMVSFLLSRGADVNRQLQSLEMTPLMCAVRHPTMLTFLLAKGALLDLCDHLGNTVFFHALHSPESVKVLLDRPFPIKEINHRNKAGVTVLHEAVQQRSPALVYLLLECGADPRVVLDDAESPEGPNKYFSISKEMKKMLKISAEHRQLSRQKISAPPASAAFMPPPVQATPPAEAKDLSAAGPPPPIR